MPLQNRVNPKGDIVVSNSRGELMGNRGCLHDADKHVVRSSRIIHWVACSLNFGQAKRTLMAPGNYTELFFLDEVTALAAGHRPCATCRRGAYKRFTTFWAAAHQTQFDRVEMDKTLHAERIGKDGAKVSYTASLNTVPDGTCVELGGEWLVVWGNRLLRWSFGGYIDNFAKPKAMDVAVLTPRSIVAVLREGYVPDLHSSAARFSTDPPTPDDEE